MRSVQVAGAQAAASGNDATDKHRVGVEPVEQAIRAYDDLAVAAAAEFGNHGTKFWEVSELVGGVEQTLDSRVRGHG